MEQIFPIAVFAAGIWPASRGPLQDRREASMKVLAKALALSDKQLLERTYDGAIAEHKLPARQYPTLEGLNTMLASDPEAKGTKAEDFVDLRFIKELDESGYIDKLYKR